MFLIFPYSSARSVIPVVKILQMKRAPGAAFFFV
jgi:hypothetical protein